MNDTITDTAAFIGEMAQDALGERDRREAELKERIRQFEDREKSFLAWAREQQRLASKSCKEWGEAGAKRQADYRNGMGYGFRECENFFTGVDAAQRQQSGAELAKAEPIDWKARAEKAEDRIEELERVIDDLNNGCSAMAYVREKQDAELYEQQQPHTARKD